MNLKLNVIQYKPAVMTFSLADFLAWIYRAVFFLWNATKVSLPEYKRPNYISAIAQYV